MRVLLILATLSVVSLLAYGFAINEKPSFIPRSNNTNGSSSGADIQKPQIQISSYLKDANVDPGQLNRNTTLNQISKLCINESGEEVIGTIGYKPDCRKFVQCGYGTENVAECQYELLFNKVTVSCDWPREAGCIEYRANDKRKLVIPAGDIIW